MKIDKTLSLKEEILKELENTNDLIIALDTHQRLSAIIENEQFKYGLFCQVEANESNYDFYAYENIAIDVDDYPITNFDIIIEKFQISKEDFNSNEKNIKKVHDELFKEHSIEDVNNVFKELHGSKDLDYR